MVLPHRFPFRWLDRETGDVASALISANGYWTRDGGGLPLPFCAELLAQGAAILLRRPGGEEAARSMRLASIERLTASSLPEAGDVIEVRMGEARAFGGLTRISGTLSRRGEPIAEGVLVLV